MDFEKLMSRISAIEKLGSVKHAIGERILIDNLFMIDAITEEQFDTLVAKLREFVNGSKYAKEYFAAVNVYQMTVYPLAHWLCDR